MFLMFIYLKVDYDVQNEINRIKSFSSNLEIIAANEPLVVYNLVKKYKKHKTLLTAVDHLSFGVNKNECFGYNFVLKLFIYNMYY
jgi:hypothetical protein